MIKIIIFISFILDLYLSLYSQLIFNFIPLFTIVSLLIIYPFYYKNNNYYYKICLITGLLYDLLFTNTLILNMLLFLFMGLIISALYNNKENNILYGLLFNSFILLSYHLSIIIILILINYLSFSFLSIMSELLSVLIINNLYYIFIYLLINKILIKKKTLYYH